MSYPSLALLLAVSFSARAQTQSSPIADSVRSAASSAPQSIDDGVRTPPPALQPPKPELTIEMRGDIYMARKMYREAIDTFRSGDPQDPVLLNKTGIAYHQLMQLDNARKSYEQALRQKKD